MKKCLLALIVLFVCSLHADDEFKMVSKMYDSGKARAIGDLVTIIISESSSSSKAEGLSTAKTANFGGSNSGFPGQLEDEGQVKLFKLFNDYATLRGLTINSNSTFDGNGSASTSENLSATITARVVDVFPNGNVVVKGERRVKMKDEEVHVIMTGIIRVRDITKANTITSAMMSDAHIYYETSGSVTDGTQPGLLWKIFQFINPF
jgi:flagellar L-ring protein precursor FlgH